MTDKGLNTTVQRIKIKSKKGNEYMKYVTPIPTALINLLGIEKGNKLVWNLKDSEITIQVVKA